MKHFIIQQLLKLFAPELIKWITEEIRLAWERYKRNKKAKKEQKKINKVLNKVRKHRKDGEPIPSETRKELDDALIDLIEDSYTRD